MKAEKRFLQARKSRFPGEDREEIIVYHQRCARLYAENLLNKKPRMRPQTVLFIKNSDENRELNQ